MDLKTIRLPLILFVCSIIIQAQTNNINSSTDYSIDVNTVFECSKDLSIDLLCPTCTEQTFSIAPNPIKNSICNVVFPSTNYNKVSITIVDLSGTQLLQKDISQEHPQIDISGIPLGVYIAIISTNNEKDILKIITE